MADHFVDVTEMIGIGKGRHVLPTVISRSISDEKSLSRAKGEGS